MDDELTLIGDATEIEADARFELWKAKNIATTS